MLFLITLLMICGTFSFISWLFFRWLGSTDYDDGWSDGWDDGYDASMDDCLKGGGKVCGCDKECGCLMTVGGE